MASATPVLQLMVAHILLMCYRWLQVGTRSGDGSQTGWSWT